MIKHAPPTQTHQLRQTDHTDKPKKLKRLVPRHHLLLHTLHRAVDYFFNLRQHAFGPWVLPLPPLGLPDSRQKRPQLRLRVPHGIISGVFKGRRVLGDRVVCEVRKGVCDAFFVVGAEREPRVAVRVLSLSLVSRCNHSSLVTCRVSLVTGHWSLVTFHLSLFTCH